MKNYLDLNRLLSRYRLVLASGSPRRVRILTEAGIQFRQIIPNIDESNHGNLEPYALSLNLSAEKAKAIIDLMEPDEIIAGFDTIVVLDDQAIGKPESEEDAIKMLNRLSGRRHTVCTAITLLMRSGVTCGDYELSDVYFHTTAEEQIREYVKSGEPLDKAGAYGIQDRGVFLVDRVEGNIDNVIGLPMNLLNILAGKLADEKGL